MNSIYAINTTRGKEFDVAEELRSIGLHPWVPIRLESRYVKEKRAAVWYDKPYVPKLMFCVIPAIYWRDVVEQKHIIGKPVELSRMDIQGMPSVKGRPPRYGLRDFKAAVEAEYADAERLKANSEYQCQYRPGQALEMLAGPFEGLTGEFKKVIRRAHDDYSRLQVEIEVFGRRTAMEVDPDKVRAKG